MNLKFNSSFIIINGHTTKMCKILQNVLDFVKSTSARRKIYERNVGTRLKNTVIDVVSTVQHY